MNDATVLWKVGSEWHSTCEPGGAEIVPLRFVVMPQRQHIELTRSEAVVGRHSLAEVRLADPDISRRHCRLAMVDGLWRVQDLNSLNGVYLNGQRVEDAALYQGDHLALGGCTLVVTQSATPVRHGMTEATEMLRSIADAMAPEAAVGEVA